MPKQNNKTWRGNDIETALRFIIIAAGIVSLLALAIPMMAYKRYNILLVLAFVFVIIACFEAVMLVLNSRAKNVKAEDIEVHKDDYIKPHDTVDTTNNGNDAAKPVTASAIDFKPLYADANPEVKYPEETKSDMAPIAMTNTATDTAVNNDNKIENSSANSDTDSEAPKGDADLAKRIRESRKHEATDFTSVTKSMGKGANNTVDRHKAVDFTPVTGTSGVTVKRHDLTFPVTQNNEPNYDMMQFPHVEDTRDKVVDDTGETPVVEATDTADTIKNAENKPKLIVPEISMSHAQIPTNDNDPKLENHTLGDAVKAMDQKDKAKSDVHEITMPSKKTQTDKESNADKTVTEKETEKEADKETEKTCEQSTKKSAKPNINKEELDESYTFSLD